VGELPAGEPTHDDGRAADPALDDGPADAALATWAAATADEDSGRPAALRSVADGAVVTLEEVTGETVRAICRLAVAPSQMSSVAPNAVSFAEALFEPHAWYRAIVADGVPVGFLMMYDDPEKPHYYLWRFMVDARHQGQGYGARAMALLLDHVRARPGATELMVSWVPGPDGSEGFYLRLGFVPTGLVEDGEVEARLAL
jgi:diamine N-acetyltransferase